MVLNYSRKNVEFASIHNIKRPNSHGIQNSFIHFLLENFTEKKQKK